MAQDNAWWKNDAPVEQSSGTDWLKADKPVEEDAPARGFKGWAQDIGATALKGAIGVPEALVGLADIPTGGAVGKFLENEGGAIGFRPKQAKEIASDWNSDATKQAQKKFQAAEGIGGKLQAAIENPSIIATSIGESLPAMGAGGVAARGILGATRLGAMGAKGAAIAGAAGEGAMMAGQQAESIRQETEDGYLTPGQSALAAGTGLIGGVVGAASGRFANRLGIGDVDTMVAQGAKSLAAPAAQGTLKSIPKKVIQGAMTEGLLEELPQSVVEQVMQNLALGKDWSEGVDEAVVLGTLSGGAMGGGASGFKGYMDSRKAPEQAPAQPPVQPPAEQPQPMGASLTGTAPADLMARGTDPLAGQIADARVLADDAAITRNDFAERNNEALTGGGMFGSRADPLANMLADQRTSDANTSVNIQRAAEKRPPMPATAAANILVAAQEQGLDFTVAPHPDGGYLVIPRAWVTPQVAKQAEASLRETLARVAQVEDAPIQRAARVSTNPAALDLNTDTVAGYVDNLRTVNTPAAKAFVGEFDAGRITRQDVEQRMAVERGKTADERLAEAAAQARAPQDPYSLPAIRPSQAMGLNPAAGPMSSAAVIAVDGGAYQSVRNQAAQTQPSTPGEPTNGVTPDQTAQAFQATPQGQEVQPAPANLKPPRGILAKKAEADAARAARNPNGQAIQPATEAANDAGAVAPPAAGRAGVSGVDEQGAVPALSNVASLTDRIREKVRDAALDKAVRQEIDSQLAELADLGKQNRVTMDDLSRLQEITANNSDRYNASRDLHQLLKTIRTRAAGNIQTETPANVQNAPQAANDGQAQAAPVEASTPAGSNAAAAGELSAARDTTGMEADGVNSRALIPAGLTLEVSGKLYPVDSLEQASEMMFKARKQFEKSKAAGNAQGYIDDAPIRDGSGRIVGYVGRGESVFEAPNAGPTAKKLYDAGMAAAQRDSAPRLPAPATPGATDVQADGVKIAEAAHQAATSHKNDLPQPTDAQKEAGNYAKGHITINGLDITIENPAGSKRRPEWPALKNHYGYFKGSVGADKDHVDLFMTDRSGDASLPVFVVDQTNRDGTFDEHKIIMGAADEAEARATYLQNYEKGWTGLGAITQMTQDEFKAWVRDPAKTKKPVALKRGVLAKMAEQKAKAARRKSEDIRDSRWESMNLSERERVAEAIGRKGIFAQKLAEKRWDRIDAEVKTKLREVLDVQQPAKPQQETETTAELSKDAGSVSQAETEKDDDGINVTAGKGSIKDKYFVEVDGDRAPGGPWDTPEQARLSGEEWKKKTIQNAKDTKQERERWNAIAENFKAGKEVTTAQIESLGLKAGTSDVRWLFPIAARLFDITSRDIRPLVKDLIRDSFTDMGAKREFVPTRKALEAIAADVVAGEQKAESAVKPSEMYRRLQQLSARANRKPYTPLTEEEFKVVVDAGLATGKKWSTGKLNTEGYGRLAQLEADETESSNARADAEDLIAEGLPFKASAVDQYGLVVPDGYVRQGGMFEKSTAKAPPAEPVKPEPAPQPKAENPAEDGAKPAQKAAEKIEDFGEKLAGARKDYAATLKDAMSVDVAAEPLSKSWPEPDYQKLLDGGADPFIVSWVHAARDEIPTKPQTSWKLSGWVKSVSLLRKVSSDMLSGEVTKERLQEMLEKPEYGNLKRQLGGRAELYQAVGHGKSLKGITFMEHHYSVYRDEKNVTKWAIEMKAKSSSFGNWPREIAVADTKDAALEQFKSKYASLDSGPKGKGKSSFVIYRKRGEPGAFVGKKIGREYIDLYKAEDVKAARAYLADNTDKLEKALERYKDTPYERGEENAPRVGDDHRNGAPVTPEVFGQTFGFRGVQFGNYVEQGRRQSDLNEAFDALMDMAAVLGIPPKAISLNGRLGLAFGARGKGGKNAPAAHYEAGNVVINLTKGGGPGSLAHEWFHAMDNYFAKQGGGAGYMTDGADGAALREEMRQAFKAVKTAVNTGALKLRSLELDKRRTKPYWSTPIEMAARSFESYVVAKLQDQNASNDYLANVVNDKVWEISEAARAEFFTGKQASPSYPYPTVDELPVLRAAFDDFFKVVQTRETESGSIELFNQRRGEDAPAAEAAAVQSAIEGKSLVEAAQFIADTGSAAQREVAAMVVKKLQAMQEAGVNLELKVAHRGEQVPQDLIFSRGYTEIGMDAKGRDVVVWLNGADVKSKVGTDYETLLHELVHAATAGAMRHAAFVKDSPYVGALKSLDSAAQAIGDHITSRFEQADAGDIELTEFEQDIRAQANNAFTSLDEVVSWALTSREAQEYLDGIPYKSGSLWTRFVRAVRSALGLSEESDTVLSEVLRAAEKLMNPQDEGTRFMRALWHKRGIMAGTQQAKGSVVFINRNFARNPATTPAQSNAAADTEDDANYGTKDQAQGTPTDRAVMAMAGEGKSADEILRFIANASKSQFNRQMANLLRRTKANPAVSIGGEMGGGAGFKFLAKYSRKNHEVTLSEGAAGKAEQILLHEMVHAATLLALDRGGEHAARMKSLYESVKAQGLADAYGMKNVGEFVAEAFTNPEFQKLLKGYKAPGGTAWDRFVAAVRRILGLSDQSQDALSAALELGVEVMRENMPLRAARSFRAEDAPAFAGRATNPVMTEEQAIARGFTMKAYRGVSKSNPFNDTGTTWLTTSREVAEAYAEEVMGYDDPGVIEVMVNPSSLPRHDASRLTDEQRAQMQADDFGNPQAVGIYDRSDDHPLGGSRRNVTVIHAPMSEVAIIDDADAEAYFGMAEAASLKNSALEQIHQTLSHPGKVSIWDKTIGTMRHLSERSPAFKPVFEAAQRFLDDVSLLANEAADVAPRLLPRVESWRDLTKKPVSAEDNKAISKPIFEGTLMWARDTDGKPVLVDDMAKKYADLSTEKKSKMLMAAGRLDDRVLRMWQGLPSDQFDALVNSRFESQMLKAGVVWKDAELKSLFNLNDNQISLYREARQAIDRSIDLTARADMLRAVGTGYAGMRDAVLELPTLADARDLLVETLHADALDNEDQADRLMGMVNTIADRFEKATELSASGYAPLSRFGRYTLDVVDAAGERQYFGLYESMRDANLAKIQMAGAFPGATITQGTMSAEAYKLFAGITPESLELFGNMLGLDAEGGDARDKAFQEYLKLSKNNHSALKRLMHRKGIAGYSEDVGRVLASFVYSNARQAAGGLNAGTIEEAVNAIPKDQGELKDVAMGLRDYVRDPQEEGQAIRGMLFAQYLGGSLASAFVNTTQPFAVTLPWLSQFGGMKVAGKHLAKALKDMAGKGAYEADLKTALDRAEEDGVVSPQEIHMLMAQARGAGGLRSGDGTRAGNARAAASNAWERTKVAWGQPFALAEQFNRRSTFIAAYRLAKERGMKNPAEFARRAVLETQFLYSKANKPKWARGAVGGTLFTFKTYSVSYLELLNRMWTQGGPEGKRAVGWAMVMLMLMGGAGGLPFLEDLEDLIDGIAQLMGYNVSSKQWRKQAIEDVIGKELGEFVNSGLSGLPGAPIDVSGRLGMGDLIPGTGLFMTKQNRERDLMEIVGPAGDLVARGFTGARKALSGDIGGAALELSPGAVRNAAKGIDMITSGQYKDAKGYKVLDTTLPEAAAKLIGFQPRSVAKVQEANSFMMRSKSYYTQQSGEIKAQWARALYEKDDGALQDVRDRLAAWNRNNPDQPIVVKMPDVWKRVREMGKDRTERIADTAPKALRQEMRELARDN